jgi:ankyrin repeat protein
MLAADFKKDAPLEPVTQAELVNAGGEEAAAKLVKKGMRLDGIIDDHGNTLLTWALMYGQTKLGKTLAECGANPNLPGENRALPLHLAAAHGDADCVAALLKAGAACEAMKDGMTALMKAASFDKRDVIRVLIENGADIESRSGAGNTPLVIAAREGRMEALDELISRHAMIDAVNAQGMTAFMESVGANRMEPAARLLAAGADIDRQNKRGTTALMHAGTRFALGEEMTRFLLGHGAKTGLQDAQGNTALMIAVTQQEGSARALIESNADLDLQNSKGATALMRAIKAGKRGLAKAMIDKGAQVNIRNSQGQTALFFAASAGDAELVHDLLERGADPLIADNAGATALSCAPSRAGDVRILLEQVEKDLRSVRANALSEGATVLDRNMPVSLPLKLKSGGPKPASGR